MDYGSLERSWIRIDWHHHTYEDQTRKEAMKNENPKDYLKLFAEDSGGIIVVTNHNTSSRSSINEYEKMLVDLGLQSQVKIIPGIECAAYPDEKNVTQKQHILYIFPDIETSESALEAHKTLEKSNAKLTLKDSITTVAKRVQELNKEFIACPHFMKSSNSYWSSRIEFGKIDAFLLHSFDVLEITRTHQANAKELLEELMEAKTTRHFEDVPCAYGTDAKNYADFADKISSLEFFNTERSFRGLQLAIRNFPQRSSSQVTKPATVTGHLKKIEMEKQRALVMGPGLNVLIGERGSGKSFLLYLMAKKLDAKILPTHNWRPLDQKYKTLLKDLKVKTEWSGLENALKPFYLPQNHLVSFIETAKEEHKKNPKIQEQRDQFVLSILPIAEIVQGTKNIVQKFVDTKDVVCKWILASWEAWKQKKVQAKENFKQVAYDAIASIYDDEKLKSFEKKLLGEKGFAADFQSSYKSLLNSDESSFDSEIRNLMKELDNRLTTYLTNLNLWELALKIISKLTKVFAAESVNVLETHNDKIMRTIETSGKSLYVALSELSTKVDELTEILKKSAISWNKYKHGERYLMDYQISNLDESFIKVGCEFKSTEDDPLTWSCFIRNELGMLTKDSEKSSNNKEKRAEFLFTLPLDSIEWTNQSSKERQTVENHLNCEDVFEILKTESIKEISSNREYVDQKLLSVGQMQDVFLKHVLNALTKHKDLLLILDQPEDDLDASTLDKILINLVKNKKDQIQIIASTHDPKLVVNADPREVIVCCYSSNASNPYFNADVKTKESWDKISELVDARKEYPLKRYVYYKEHNK